MNQKSTPTSRPGPFKTLVGSPSPLKVVDVGASPLDGDDAPYAALVAAGDADLVAFEAHGPGYAELLKTKRQNETILPQAVGDGMRHTLRLCQAPGMSSLLPPNPDLLKLFHLFPNFARVLSTIEIDTVRLDDVPETAGVDLIKIDIQGAELIVLANSPKRLREVSVIHTEVLFLPMYQGQPLFSDIETFLRSNGFMLHCFQRMERRMVAPFMIDGNPYAELNQIVWADAIFVRDLARLDLYSDRQLLVTANLMHDIYESFDISFLVLTEFDRRRETGLSDKYLSALQSNYPGRSLWRCSPRV